MLDVVSGDKTIREFFESGLRNYWCVEGDFHVYIVRRFDKTLCVSRIHNVHRQENVYRRAEYRSTGQFKKFMDQFEKLSKDCGYKGIRFISVINEFLPNVLEKRGYKLQYNNLLLEPEDRDYLLLFATEKQTG